MSSAFYLARLIENEPGVSISGSAHITIDAKTSAHLAHKLDLPASYVYSVLAGVPVKTALGITQWALAIPDPLERVKALRNWSDKHGGGISEWTYYQARQMVRESHGVVRGGAA